MRSHAAAQIDAVDDIAPLVRAAHLQVTIVATRQFDIVIGLADHVVELDEAHLLFAFQPQPHRIHRQHPVDGKVAPDVSEHFDVAELQQPVGIVDHDGVVGAVAELQNLCEHTLDRGLVRLDLLDRTDGACLVLA